MLKESYFRSPEREYACYCVAGSFTGFLVRSYGWPAYSRFYRRANRWNFHRAFKKSFGTTLPQAEERWWVEVVGRVRDPASTVAALRAVKAAGEITSPDSRANMDRVGASFKDFLIRRYGLQTCQQFFENRTRTDFHALFQEAFGATHDETTQAWFEELRLAVSGKEEGTQLEWLMPTTPGTT